MVELCLGRRCGRYGEWSGGGGVEQLMGCVGYLLWAVVRDNAVATMKSLTTCESETRQHLTMLLTHCCPGN